MYTDNTYFIVCLCFALLFDQKERHINSFVYAQNCLFSAPRKLFLKTSFYTETMEILLMKIGQIEKLKGNLN